MHLQGASKMAYPLSHRGSIILALGAATLISYCRKWHIVVVEKCTVLATVECFLFSYSVLVAAA